MESKLLHVAAALAMAMVASACEAQEGPRTASHSRLARVTCGSHGTTTTTPVVRPQLDGVHILFDNEATRHQYYIRASSDQTNNHGGQLTDVPKEVVSFMPPGEILVGCFETARDIPYEARSDRFVSITVVDAEDHWVEPRLPCEQERAGEFASDRTVGNQPNVEGLIRDLVPGVQPTDAFEHPGYPRTEFHAEARHLVREGEAVAQFAVYQQRSRWHVSVWRCPDVAIGLSNTERN